MCWVTSTSATARSRVACRTVKPSVQTSTTSPALAWPRCHSTIAQASTATVSTMVSTACSRRSRSRYCRLRRRAVSSRPTVRSNRLCSRWMAPKVRTSGMLPMTSASSPSTLAALVGETVMQGRAARRELEQQQHDDGRDRREGRRHGHADDGEKGDGAQRRQAGRQDVPDEKILHCECGIRRRRDAARQRSRQSLGEIVRRMSGEMPEELAAQVAGDADEGIAGDPAGQAPQKIVGGDQRHQQREGEPDGAVGRAARQHVDQELHAVLRAHRAGDGADHGREDGGMRQRPPAHVAQQEGNRPLGVRAEAIHSARCDDLGSLVVTEDLPDVL